jgi:hypothetical protein
VSYPICRSCLTDDEEAILLARVPDSSVRCIRCFRPAEIEARRTPARVDPTRANMVSPGVYGPYLGEKS